MIIEENILIDSVDSYDASEGIICKSVIPSDASVFKGHFPGNPVIPGVLLIEMMAQASVYYTAIASNFSSMPYLALVKSSKFRQFIGPGDELLINSKLSQKGAGYSAFKANIRRGGIAANAEFILRSVPFKNNQMKSFLVETVTNALEK